MSIPKINGYVLEISMVIVVLIAGVSACKGEITAEYEASEGLPASSTSAAILSFRQQCRHEERFELGRKLFYDPLPSNNTISCGSCHTNLRVYASCREPRYIDRMGTWNSPPIMNLAWSISLMWDGGIVDLDLQPIAPITNHVEMDDSMPNVLNKLRNSSAYPALFQKAHGSPEITSTGFLKALAIHAHV